MTIKERACSSKAILWLVVVVGAALRRERGKGGVAPGRRAQESS